MSSKLRPCPAVGFQRVVFEQRRKKGWRKIGSGVTSGKRCKAKATVKARKLGGPGSRPVKLRARFDAVGALKSAHSKRVKVELR
ncbi:MAG: hypothetical protein R2700_14140 [Solirubrobacterales bacterium]